MKAAWLCLAVSAAALAVALAALFRGCGYPSVPAGIVFENAEHDFGRVRPGKLPKAVFPFRNAGGEVLHLRMMTPCCGPLPRRSAAGGLRRGALRGRGVLPGQSE